jgi:uncharacterized protein
MENFLYPAIGGLLIGLSASILLLFNGKIAGISSIFWNSFHRSNRFDSLLFILGLPIGSMLAYSWLGIATPRLPDDNMFLVLLSGLLVGFGVKLGSGCTSGHGVCGIGRLSIRSIVATATFITSGIITVYLTTLL